MEKTQSFRTEDPKKQNSDHPKWLESEREVPLGRTTLTLILRFGQILQILGLPKIMYAWNGKLQPR